MSDSLTKFAFVGFAVVDQLSFIVEMIISEVSDIELLVLELSSLAMPFPLLPFPIVDGSIRQTKNRDFFSLQGGTLELELLIEVGDWKVLKSFSLLWAVVFESCEELSMALLLYCL
jgi:hypothetical protein